MYVYDDGDENLNNKSHNIIVDTFEREPYIIKFSSASTGSVYFLHPLTFH